MATLTCLNIQAHGDALGRGMVLVMSLWDDHDSNMLWLDSDFPLDRVIQTHIKIKTGINKFFLNKLLNIMISLYSLDGSIWELSNFLIIKNIYIFYCFVILQALHSF